MKALVAEVRPSRLERASVAVILVVWCVLAGIIYVAKTTGCDFLPLIVAARLAARGLDASIYARAAENLQVEDPTWLAEAAALGYDGIVYPYLYPPLVAYALIPFANIDYAWLRYAAVAIDVIALGAIVILSAWQWKREWLRLIPLASLLFGFAFTVPFAAGVIALNIQTLIILLAVVAMIASQRERPALAGLALALAAGIKILPGIIAFYWLVSRRYDCVAWFALGLAAFAGASLLIGGVAINLEFVANARDLSNILPLLSTNKGLPMLLYDLAGSGVERVGTGVIPLPHWVSLSNLAILLAGLAFVLRGARRYRDVPVADAAGMVAVFLLVTMASPIAWHHYYRFLIVAVVIWGGLRMSGSWSWSLPVGLALLTSLPLVPPMKWLAVQGMPASLIGGELVASTILLVGLLLLRQRSAPESPPVATARQPKVLKQARAD